MFSPSIMDLTRLACNINKNLSCRISYSRHFHTNLIITLLTAIKLKKKNVNNV